MAPALAGPSTVLLALLGTTGPRLLQHFLLPQSLQLRDGNGFLLLQVSEHLGSVLLSF